MGNAIVGQMMYSDRESLTYMHGGQSAYDDAIANGETHPQAMEAGRSADAAGGAAWYAEMRNGHGTDSTSDSGNGASQAKGPFVGMADGKMPNIRFFEQPEQSFGTYVGDAFKGSVAFDREPSEFLSDVGSALYYGSPNVRSDGLEGLASVYRGYAGAIGNSIADSVTDFVDDPAGFIWEGLRDTAVLSYDILAGGGIFGIAPLDSEAGLRNQSRLDALQSYGSGVWSTIGLDQPEALGAMIAPAGLAVGSGLGSSRFGRLAALGRIPELGLPNATFRNLRQANGRSFFDIAYPRTRGDAIHEAAEYNLHHNFKTYDHYDFDSRTAVSLKSVDLTSSSYLDVDNLRYKLQSHVRTAADGDYKVKGPDFALDASLIDNRVLQIAIRANTASPAQLQALRHVANYGLQQPRPVVVQYLVVP